MIRKQVFIRKDQNARLKAAAARSGRSESALIREGIDRVLAEKAGAEPAAETARDDNWKRAILEAAGVWADRDDIDEIMAESRASWDRRFEELMRQWRGSGSDSTS
jgi:hypothetical protein